MNSVSRSDSQRPMLRRAWLAAAGLFLTGMAVGSLLTVLVGIRVLRSVVRAPVEAAGPVDRLMGRWQRDLISELKLDAAQSERMRQEFARSTQELKALRVETVRQVQRVLDDTVTRVAGPLTPEQRELLYRNAEKRLRRLGLDAPPKTASH